MQITRARIAPREWIPLAVYKCDRKARFALRSCVAAPRVADRGLADIARLRQGFGGAACAASLREIVTWLAQPKLRRLVPLAGIEPALLAELDFESSASTSSATGAFAFPAPNRTGACEAGGL
jgi:hypothetical protein